MKNKTKEFKLLIIALTMLIIYSSIVPVIPISKFMFSNKNIIKLSPYNLYIIREKSLEKSSSFEMYMNKKGWMLSDENIDSGWAYVKDSEKKYFYTDHFIHAVYNEKSIKLYHGMTYLIEFQKFIYNILYTLYVLPIFIFVLYLIQNKKYINFTKRKDNHE